MQLSKQDRVKVGGYFGLSVEAVIVNHPKKIRKWWDFKAMTDSGDEIHYVVKEDDVVIIGDQCHTF